MTPMSRIVALAAALLAAPLAPLAAQPGDGAAAGERMPVPFAVGERLVYDLKFGAINVGDASMEVLGIVPMRGREAWHTSFRVKGGTLFYKVRDVFESWFDVRSLASLRHFQDKDEGAYERKRTFEMYPERSTFREDQKPEQPSVAQPLDDGSFIYFLRTVPLEVGRTYSFDRYFRPDRNPVTIQVLRRERVQVPAGTFDAVVIRPTIKTKGIFSEGGRAEVWISDDDRRIILQLKSHLKFGSLNLYLKEFRPGTAPGSR